MKYWILELEILKEMKPGDITIISNIQKKLGCTYSAAFRSRNNLIKKGFIKITKKGRKDPIWLTKKGENVSSLLKELGALLDE